MLTVGVGPDTDFPDPVGGDDGTVLIKVDQFEGFGCIGVVTACIERFPFGSQLW